MPAEVWLTADIGGTWLRAASWLGDLGDHPPVRQRRVAVATTAREPTAALLDALRAACPPGARVRAVGLAVAGFVDAARGLVLHAPNIPAWRDEPLAARVAEVFAAPVTVVNDANAAALAEARWGAGRGADPVLFVTVSTGIGGGIVAHGRLFAGARGLAGELGHLTLDPNGPRCSCGGRGHLEALASGWAIARDARQRVGRALDARGVAQAAATGQAWAQDLLRQAAAVLGRALADLSHLLAPEAIVIGGGVSRSGPLWWDALRAAYRAHLMHPAFDAPLRMAALGDDAGLLGAALASGTSPARA